MERREKSSEGHRRTGPSITEFQAARLEFVTGRFAKPCEPRLDIGFRAGA